MLLWSSLSSWVQRSNLNQFKHPQFSQSPAHSSRPSTTWPFLVQVHQPLAATGWISKIDRSKAIGLYTLRTVTKKEHSITWLYEIQKDQTACSCFKQGSVSHTSTKHPMRLHCIATLHCDQQLGSGTQRIQSGKCSRRSREADSKGKGKSVGSKSGAATKATLRNVGN